MSIFAARIALADFGVKIVIRMNKLELGAKLRAGAVISTTILLEGDVPVPVSMVRGFPRLVCLGFFLQVRSSSQEIRAVSETDRD
jgi:hypothetical protein